MKKLLMSLVVMMLVGAIETNAMTARQQAEARAAKKAREKAQAPSAPAKIEEQTVTGEVAVEEEEWPVPSTLPPLPGEEKKPFTTKPLPEKPQPRPMTVQERIETFDMAKKQGNLKNAMDFLEQYKSKHKNIQIPDSFEEALKDHFEGNQG